MAIKARGKPEVGNQLVVHLVVKDAARALAFYERAFGARELYRTTMPDGRIIHAELALGDSVLFVAEEMGPNSAFRAPASLGGTTFTLERYVDDVDAAVARAFNEGAEVIFPAQDMFWGDRYAQVRDPFGHVWALATEKETLTPEQAMQRMKRWMER